MKDIATKRALGVLLFCGILLLGCVERKLEQRPAPIPVPDGTLHLTLNWPDGVPQGARVLLYGADGTLHSEHMLAQTEQVLTTELTAGEYRLVVHNTDTQNVDFTEINTHGSVTVFAGSGVVPQAGSEIVAPRYVYSSSRPDQVETLIVTAGETTRFTTTPVRLTHEVKFRFTILGLESIAALTGRLSGISPGIVLATGAALPISCVQTFVGVPIAHTRTKASDAIWFDTGLEFFDLLSPSQSEQSTNNLDVAITDGTGRVYAISADITSVVQDIITANGGTLPIEIPLELEVAVNSQTNNVTVTVTPWDESGTGSGSPRPE